MTYPPSHSEAVRLFDELKQLDSTTDDERVQRKYEIIHDLAEANFYEARPYFMAGLNRADPDYRYACISALATHWQDKDLQFLKQLLELSEHDPDSLVRLISIDSLGRRRVGEALPALKRIIENENAAPDLRQHAYEAILGILGAGREAYPRWTDQFDETLVDRELMNSISGDNKASKTE